MKQTLFHRATDASYPDTACDVASAPVIAISTGTPAGYVGLAWGEHPDPPDCLRWQVLDIPEDAPDEDTPSDPIAPALQAWGLTFAR